MHLANRFIEVPTFIDAPAHDEQDMSVIWRSRICIEFLVTKAAAALAVQQRDSAGLALWGVTGRTEY